MLLIINYDKRYKQVSNRLGTFLGKPGWMVTFINRGCSADKYNKDLDPGHSWPAVLPRDGGNPASTGQPLTRVIVSVVAGSLFRLISSCSHGLSTFSPIFTSDPNTPFQILAPSTLLPLSWPRWLSSSFLRQSHLDCPPFSFQSIFTPHILWLFSSWPSDLSFFKQALANQMVLVFTFIVWVWKVYFRSQKLNFYFFLQYSPDVSNSNVDIAMWRSLTYVEVQTENITEINNSMYYL